jgi:hypothetical protein
VTAVTVGLASASGGQTVHFCVSRIAPLWRPTPVNTLPPPQAETGFAEPAASPSAPSTRPWFWVTVAAGGAAIVAAFMPWVTATAPFVGSVSFNGVDGGRDGIVSAVLGVAVIVVGLLFRSRRATTGTAVALGIMSALIALVGVIDLNNVNDAIAGVDSQYVHASAGAGLYVTLAAGVAGIVAAFMHRAAK